ncbi:hypothetical protein AVEN_233831-1 [Araneus ventricosus]|uniref:Uncharacterized protein n=1 Tax=Araneus ventricosus TaxID=182803 RepID=A0A4Y2H700_ARAVE|nr:hypothetical protein AVEN_233831-1 [Araneus ventricosus]
MNTKTFPISCSRYIKNASWLKSTLHHIALMEFQTEPFFPLLLEHSINAPFVPRGKKVPSFGAPEVYFIISKPHLSSSSSSGKAPDVSGMIQNSDHPTRQNTLIVPADTRRTTPIFVSMATMRAESI